jgi:glycosyltransferase involved in cell wall biosynthesis
VDNAFYRDGASSRRQLPHPTLGLSHASYFLSVCRFVPAKNLIRLIDAFARYRDHVHSGDPWDLVLCGDGPQADAIAAAIARSRHAGAFHLPGFLQASDLIPWYAHASAFVLPSLSEPWGLVANEAASAGLPLLLSQRAGCAQTFISETEGVTSSQFDPLDVEEMAHKLMWMTLLPEDERCAMGQRAMQLVDRWGPERFAQGALEAVTLATECLSTAHPRSLQQVGRLNDTVARCSS